MLEIGSDMNFSKIKPRLSDFLPSPDAQETVVNRVKNTFQVKPK